MWVTLHALSLLLLPLLTAAAIWRSPTGPKLGVVACATLVGALMTAVLFPSLDSCCADPPPWRQFFIPTGCALLAMVFIRNSPLSGAMTIVSLISAILLTLQSHKLDGWTRNYNLAVQSAGIARSARESVLEQLGRVTDNRSYPPGWLRDLSNGEVASAAAMNPLTDSWVEPAWHSWLSGLYRRHGIPQDFWFPGGSVAEARDRIEIRHRPDVTLAQWNREWRASDDSVTFADFLGEFALAHRRRLPNSIDELVEIGISQSSSGELVQRRTTKRVSAPERFRWRVGEVIDALPFTVDPQGAPTSQPRHHLMWDADGAIVDEVLDQLDARIRWKMTH